MPRIPGSILEMSYEEYMQSLTLILERQQVTGKIDPFDTGLPSRAQLARLSQSGQVPCLRMKFSTRRPVRGDLAAYLSLRKIWKTCEHKKVLPHIQAVQKMWRAKLFSRVHEGKDDTFSLASQINCRPACVSTTPHMRPCGSRLCPFCHARQVKRLIRSLPETAPAGAEIWLCANRTEYVPDVNRPEAGAEVQRTVAAEVARAIKTRRARARRAAGGFSMLTPLLSRDRWIFVELDVLLFIPGVHGDPTKIGPGRTNTARCRAKIPFPQSRPAWRQLERRIGAFLAYPGYWAHAAPRKLHGLSRLMGRDRHYTAFTGVLRTMARKSATRKTDTVLAKIKAYGKERKYKLHENLRLLAEYIDCWQCTMMPIDEYLQRRRFAEEHWTADPMATIKELCPYTAELFKKNPARGTWTPTEALAVGCAFFDRFEEFEAEKAVWDAAQLELPEADRKPFRAEPAELRNIVAFLRDEAPKLRTAAVVDQPDGESAPATDTVTPATTPATPAPVISTADSDTIVGFDPVTPPWDEAAAPAEKPAAPQVAPLIEAEQFPLPMAIAHPQGPQRPGSPSLPAA